MGYAVGATIPGTTTLTAFIDTAFGNKSGSLPASSAVITALEPTYFQVGWKTVDAGHSLVYIRINARPVLPSTIAV